MLSSLISKLWNNIVYFITTTVASYIISDQNMLVSTISIDSLLSATKFGLTFVFNKDNSTFFTSSIIDRYIVYAIIYMFYNTVMIFWWLDDLFIMKILFMNIPLFIDYLLKYYAIKITEIRLEITKRFLSKIIVKIIKYYSEIYLNKKVVIKSNEIMPLIKEHGKIIDYLVNIIKNMLIIMLLNYVRTYSSTLYFSIKRIYHYKTSEVLNSFVTKDHSRELLINIIDTRNWSELLKPNTFKAVMHVYQTNSNDISLSEIIIKFNLAITTFFTLWTLSSFINIPALIPIIIVNMILINYVRNRIYSKNKLIINIIALILILFGIISDVMYISFLSEFGGILLINNGTFMIMKTIYKKCKSHIINVNMLRIYQWLIITIYMMIYANTGVILLGLSNNAVLHCIVLYISTHISGFKIYHIMFNTIILFACDRIFNIWEYMARLLINCKNMCYRENNVFDLNNEEFIRAISVDADIKIDKYEIIDNYLS